MKYKIINAHKTYCQPEWEWVNSGACPDDFVLWLVISGHGQAVGDMGQLGLKPGMCILWRCWERHVAIHDPKNPLIVPWVTFQFLNDDGVAYCPKHLPPRIRVIKNVEFISEIMQRSIEGYLTGREAESVYWLDVALHEVNNYDLMSAGNKSFHWQYDSIDIVSKMIMENPFRRFSLAELADISELSVDHFIRVFKRCKGITPGEFMLRHRVQTACDLLKYSNLNITRISEKLDYPSIYAFSKQFCQRMGQSPSDYRKNL